MRIEVTAEDIAAGRQCDGECCPIALAMKRAGWTGRPHAAYSFLTNGSAYGMRSRTPRDAQAWMARFDDEDFRAECKPFSFEVKVFEGVEPSVPVRNG